MPYRVDFSREAARQVDEFFRYLRRYSFETAEKYQRAFQQAIDQYLVQSPNTFGFFRETGPPYRAFLFNVSRRTTYWVIYRIYEEEKLVRVLRFWNTAREPGTHGLSS